MDVFHQTNTHKATAIDYTYNTLIRRDKGDGNRLRRYARRKLKQECRDLTRDYKVVEETGVLYE